MSYEDEYTTDHLHEARELLALAGDPDTRANDDEWRCQREAGVHALVDIAQSFRQFNSDRSQWYREVLEVLTQAKEPEGSLRSGQPAAAPDGQEEWDPCECGGACGSPKEEK